MAVLPAGFEIETPSAAPSQGLTLPAGFEIERSGPAFDLESFAPAGDLAQPPQDQSRDVTVLNLAKEFAAGVNRPIFQLIDAFGTDTVNAALNLAGSQRQIPGALETFGAEKGQFAGPGLPTEIAAKTGEFATLAAGGGALLRAGAQALPAALPGESAITGVARQLGATTPQQDIILGGVSGAGGALGEQLGGEAGEVAGAVLAPLAAGGAATLASKGIQATVQSLTNKLGKNINLIDEKTGLPSPQLEKALRKRDLDFGSIVDDVDNLPVIRGDKSADEIVDEIIVRKLKTGSKDSGLSDIRLDQGRIVADDLGVEAVRQGYRKGDVAAAKGANQATRSEMNRMLTMGRQILSDTSKAQEFRPSDVVGDHVLNRFSFIRSKADGLRSELDRIAKKTQVADPTKIEGSAPVTGLKGLEINAGAVEDNTISQLDRLGLNIPENVLGNTTLLNKWIKQPGSFSGSDISKDKTSQRIIKDVVDLLSEPVKVDAFRAHKLKRQLDNLIDFNKKSARGLTETGKNFAISVRRSLNEAIRNVSPQYARVNDDLSSAIETMNNFERVLGGSIDVFAPGANKAIGQDLKGLLSVRKSRVKLENAINDIDDTVKDLGGSFDVNVRDLNQFANTISDRFGAIERTSFKGEIEAAGKKALRGKAGAREFAVEQVAKKFEKISGVNDKSALDVMQKILKRKETR